jgi:hypothetical protein
MARHTVLARWLCVLALALVVALGVAACGTTTPTNPGSPAPTHSSGY